MFQSCLRSILNGERVLKLKNERSVLFGNRRSNSNSNNNSSATTREEVSVVVVIVVVGLVVVGVLAIVDRRNAARFWGMSTK